MRSLESHIAMKLIITTHLTTMPEIKINKTTNTDTLVLMKKKSRGITKAISTGETILLPRRSTGPLIWR